MDVCLGHSLGEFAALVSSRHLEYEDALKSMYFGAIFPLSGPFSSFETCLRGLYTWNMFQGSIHPLKKAILTAELSSSGD